MVLEVSVWKLSQNEWKSAGWFSINTFAKASGYPSYQSFDFYETTGDMANWLSKINIPAISVLLSTHEDIEWDKNRKGIEALLDLYNK